MILPRWNALHVFRRILWQSTQKGCFCMNKTLSLIVALCLFSGLCAFAAPAMPLPLDAGVYWGMSASDLASAYGVSQYAISKLDARVTTSEFFADLLPGADTIAGGIFIDDMLVCMAWGNMSSETYTDICEQIAVASGPAAENDPAYFKALIDTLCSDFRYSDDFRGWRFSDGTYLAAFRDPENSCYVLYINEALMKLLLSVDSGAATETAADSVIPFGGKIPWGISSEELISQLALDDYDEYSPIDSLTVISTEYYCDDNGMTEDISFAFINDQLVCIDNEYFWWDSSDSRYAGVLASVSSEFGAPETDCSERISSIFSSLVPDFYTSADFSNTCGWELSNGSFMFLADVCGVDSFVLMIANEALLSSLSAE